MVPDPLDVVRYNDSAIADSVGLFTSENRSMARLSNQRMLTLVPVTASLTSQEIEPAVCVISPGTELTQEELIQMAFAGDDVAADFAAHKAAEAEEDAPKEEAPTGLPGWGSWANPRRMAREAVESAAKFKRCVPTLHFLKLYFADILRFTPSRTHPFHSFPAQKVCSTQFTSSHKSSL